MTDIASIDKARFEGLVGQVIEAASFPLTVESVKDGKAHTGEGRPPFSVTLVASTHEGAPVFQGLVPVTLPGGDTLNLTVTRIMGRHDEAVYQILFN